jgi:[pyruvate, water dikinase]-phosphate phosphotransferase / [pyruvate, water dikinase] kinase
MIDNNFLVFVVSDSIGETAEQVARAAISQFNSGDHEIVRFSYISDIEHINEVINEARNSKCIIAHTMVIQELKEYLTSKAAEYHIPTVDIMGPMIQAITRVTDLRPKYEPGLIRKLDEKYFKKVEAIEFAVKYDDGKDPRGVKKADVVLIGISRTSKTPLSMYLAHKHIKVANIPLVPEVPVPEELYQINPRKIIGLTTNPLKLNEIRQERLKALGLSFDANYASMERILYELEYAEQIMKRVNCPIINVANKAVEESAGIILDIIKDSNRGK